VAKRETEKIVAFNQHASTFNDNSRAQNLTRMYRKERRFRISSWSTLFRVCTEIKSHYLDAQNVFFSQSLSHNKICLSARQLTPGQKCRTRCGTPQLTPEELPDIPTNTRRTTRHPNLTQKQFVPAELERLILWLNRFSLHFNFIQISNS